MREGWLRDGARTAVWAAVFVVAVVVGRQTVPEGSQMALVWPAAGASALWLLGSRTPRTRLVDAGVLAVVAALANAATGAPADVSTGYGLANVAHGLVAAAAGRRLLPGVRPVLRHQAEVLSVLLVSAAAAAAAMPLTALAAGLGGDWPSLAELGKLLVRNGLSTFLVLGVAAAAPATWRGWWGALAAARRHGEALLVTAVVVGVGLVVFGGNPHQPSTWLVLPGLVWSAMRLGTLRTALLCTVTGALVLVGTVAGRGPFSEATSAIPAAALSQAFVLVVSLLFLLLAVSQDERSDALRRSQESEEALRRSIDAALVGNAVVVLDGPSAGRVVEANQALLSFLDRDDVVGSSWASLVDPRDRADVRLGLLALSVQPEAPWRGEVRCTTRTGETRWAEVAAAVHPGGEDERRATVQLMDITARKDVELELARQATHDPLTGLPNRTALHRRLDAALRASRRDGRGVAVVFLDVDHFKRVNDEHGHAAGDELLVTLAHRLVQAVRPEDVVARISGDEFVVVAPGIGDEEDARSLADRITAAVREPIDAGWGRVEVGVSGGLVIGGADDDAASLLARSDAAMYEVKRHGRGAVELSGGELVHRVERRRLLGDALEQLLDADAVELRFDPVIDAGTRLPVAWEAVLDWTAPDGDLVPAEELRAVARSRGYGPRLDAAVLMHACTSAASWARPGSVPPVVHVDVGARRAALTSVLHATSRALEASGLPPGCLVLELAEAELDTADPELPHQMAALRALGVRLAVDGFGSGSARLTRLLELPFEVVKLDAHLLARMPGAAARATVHGLVGAAAELGWGVVADGVDHVEQEESLRRMGCTLLQGERARRAAGAAPRRPTASPRALPSQLSR